MSNIQQSYRRDQVVQIISSVLSKIETSGDVSATGVLQELKDLQRIIDEARADIGAARPGDINDKHIPTATDTTDNVEVSLDQVSTVRFGDYMNSIPLPAMLSVFKAEEWDNNGLLVTDSALIYSIVDVLLGGRKGTPAIRVEGRPYTTIESKLVEKMVQVTLGDLSSAFDPLSPVSFGLDRMETNPRFATITQSNNACVLARLRVDMGDRGGRVEVLIPYATLEPIRELLLQMFMGEKFGRDSIWENHLTQELHKTDIQLQAILGEKIIELGDMLNWKVGTRVLFNTRVNDDLELRCGHFPMFRGPVGQKQENIAVRIENYLEPEEDDEQ